MHVLFETQKIACFDNYKSLKQTVCTMENSFQIEKDQNEKKNKLQKYSYFAVMYS